METYGDGTIVGSASPSGVSGGANAKDVKAQAAQNLADVEEPAGDENSDDTIVSEHEERRDVERRM